MIAEATDILADSAEEDMLNIDAVLATEFEGFVELDRRYLQNFGRRSRPRLYLPLVGRPSRYVNCSMTPSGPSKS